MGESESQTIDRSATATLSAAEQRTLLEIAIDAIRRRLDGRVEAPLLAEAQVSPALREPRATFVTLRIGGELRGCCGSLRAREPLYLNVAHSAVSAAFGDPRFPPLEREEFPELDLHLSLLTTPETLPVLTEADLLAVLRPGVDGLILSEDGRQGVFLPSVWEQIPEPREFVRRLKQKMGLPLDYWSPWMKAERFETESVHGTVRDLQSDPE